MTFNIKGLTREEVVTTSRTDVEVVNVIGSHSDPYFGSVSTSHSSGMSTGKAWAAAYFNMSTPWDNRYIDAYCKFGNDGYMNCTWTPSGWFD